MYHVIILNDGSPTVTIEIENNLFVTSEVLDWYAEVYDFDRTKLTAAVTRKITYNIDEDEVRKKKWAEYHRKQAEANRIFNSGISVNSFDKFVDVEEFDKLTS